MGLRFGRLNELRFQQRFEDLGVAVRSHFVWSAMLRRRVGVVQMEPTLVDTTVSQWKRGIRDTGQAWDWRRYQRQQGEGGECRFFTGVGMHRLTLHWAQETAVVWENHSDDI